MDICGVPWREGIKRPKTPIFSPSGHYTFRILGKRPILLYSIIYSLIAFPMTPKYVTLYNPERPLYVKFCFCIETYRIFCMDFENKCINTNKGRPILEEQKCSAWTVGSFRQYKVYMDMCRVHKISMKISDGLRIPEFVCHLVFLQNTKIAVL